MFAVVMFCLVLPFLLVGMVAVANNGPQILMVAAGMLIPDPGQPRKVFDKEKLEQLAASIKERGMFNPIRVRWDAERQLYIIVAGERRFRAALLLGLKEIPCIVAEALSEQEILIDQLAENLVRDDFRPMEVARGFERFMRLAQVNGSELAARLHVSNATVSRTLSLLLLPADLQEKVGEERGHIPSSTAYELVRFPDEASMRQWAELVMNGKATRSQVQEELHSRIGKKAVTPRGNKVTLDVEVGDSHYRLVITNGEALDLEHVTSALSAALKRTKKATTIEELKGD